MLALKEMVARQEDHLLLPSAWWSSTYTDAFLGIEDKYDGISWAERTPSSHSLGRRFEPPRIPRWIELLNRFISASHRTFQMDHATSVAV